MAMANPKRPLFIFAFSLMLTVFFANITAAQGRSGAAPTSDAASEEDTTYSGTDDSGTLVFSDDPTKVPKNKTNRRTTKRVARNRRAVNFVPGNYEVKNWMEIPGRGRGKYERQVVCLSEHNYKWPNDKDSGCTLVSEDSSGDTIKWESKCNGSYGMTGLSGTITYLGDSFNGFLYYHGAAEKSLKVGVSGARIGDCSEGRAVSTTSRTASLRYQKGSGEFVALERQLIKSWNLMKEQLGKGRIESALSYFLQSSRSSFRTQFAAVQGDLPKMANDLGSPRLVEVIEESFAKCELLRVENGQTYSFALEFVLDTDGVWRIRTF